MKQTLSFTYKNICALSNEQVTHHVAHLEQEATRMRTALTQQYNSDYASLYAPLDTTMHAEVNATAHELQKLKPHMLIVVGIGGSNLGTMAVHHALHGTLYNQTSPACRVYFADTVDTHQTHTLVELTQKTWAQGGTVVVNVVSKSGTTTETIALLSVFIDLFKQHTQNWSDYFVATTDHDSKLWHYAHNNDIHTLAIPTHVGGRYSVLSPVGLFPLALLGVDIANLCLGARDALTHTLDSLHTSPAALNASIVFEHSMHTYAVYNTFVFSPQLASFGAWFRQLYAESLGKQEEHILVPTTAVGSTDLHSIGQEYLGGPRTIYTTFISADVDMTSEVYTSKESSFDSLVPHVTNKKLSTLMAAILHGTQAAYQHDKRPFTHMHLGTLDAYTVGALLQYKMLEVMYLGSMLHVNPFDQPHVELYKKETRKLLAS